MEPEIVATPAPAPAMRCYATVQETELVETGSCTKRNTKALFGSLAQFMLKKEFYMYVVLNEIYL